jgi:hypothetical protein
MIEMRFNPGLAQEQVDRLAGEVQPYRLPRELSALYRSKNGQPWGQTYFWGCRMLPLDEAISQWKLLRQMLAELDLGCPLWFPIANEGQDYFLAVLDEAEQDTSVVLHFFLQDTTVEVWTPTIAAAVRLAEDGAREDVRGGQSFSTGADESWPESWQLAVGMTPGSLVLRGADTLLADLRGGRPQGTVVAKVIALAVTGGGCVIEVRDESGTAVVAVPAGRPGGSLLQISNVYEFDLSHGAAQGNLTLLQDVVGNVELVATALRLVRREPRSKSR